MPTTTPNAILRTIFATLALLLGSTALAQSIGGEPTEHGGAMDAWIAEQQAQLAAAYRAWTAYFLKLYREETGDDQTPDALAIEWGRHIYCARHAAECWEAQWMCREGWETVVRDRTRCTESWGVVDASIAPRTAADPLGCGCPPHVPHH